MSLRKPPTVRERILQALRAHGPMKLKDLLAQVGCSETGLYVYLRELRDNNLVVALKNGTGLQRTSYELTPAGMDAAEESTKPKEYSLAQVYRLTGPQRSQDEQMAARAVALYETGMSTRRIAFRLGRDTGTIWTWLVRSGVELRERGPNDEWDPIPPSSEER